MTSESGSITDTFAYDTYGKQTARTGESDIIFGYNGKYGVMTEPNGLVYMRARYYSPELRRFINADVIAGEISNAITLNRYAYANGNPISTVDPLGLKGFANGNPVSNIDPYGLSAEREDGNEQIKDVAISITELWDNFNNAVDGFELIIGDVKFIKNGKYIDIQGDKAILLKYGIKQTRINANDIKSFEGIAKFVNTSSAVSSALKSKSNWALAGLTITMDTIYEVSQYEETTDKWIVGSYTVVSGIIGAGLSIAGSATVAAAVGSAVCPGVGTVAGILAGVATGWIYEKFINAPAKEYIVIELVERY